MGSLLWFMLKGLAVMGLLASGASSALGQRTSNARGYVVDDKGRQSAAEQRYRKAFDAWKAYIDRPELALSSRTPDYTQNEAYDRIVALGKEALPFIMSDIEQGGFLLNDAVRRITRIDVTKLYPKANVIGEQDVSMLWLRWWREKGKAIYGRGR
jgi:hypothetical protein